MSRIPFIGRTGELATLESEWRRGNAFVVMYGRRRVGKTKLIKQFIEQKDALYFLASREDEALNRHHFAERAAAYTGNALLAQADFSDWRPIFQAIADAKRDKPYVIVIDEFPYLVEANKAMPSIMQYVWDEVLAGTEAMLILCGSSVSMMRDTVLSHDSPLYGRRTAQMRIKPLAFSELRDSWPDTPFSALMDVYAITGGVPKYLEFFNPDADIQQEIVGNVLSTSGFLYEEPEFLLAEETRGAINHLSILSAVAQGNRKAGEIASFLGKRAQDLTAYLQALTSLGFLERRTPFNERYPERSKNGLYAVSDSFLLFWLTYVQPFRGELEMGNKAPSLEAINRTFESTFVPFVFERVSAEAFAKLCVGGQIDFSPSRIGGYWNRSGSVELDVCAVDNSHDRVFLGECKYHERRPVSMREYQALAAKAGSMPHMFDTEPLLGMFSRTGFEQGLLDLAQEDPNLVLINEDLLVL